MAMPFKRIETCNVHISQTNETCKSVSQNQLPSLSLSAGWLVVDQCAQKLPHSPDGIISFSLTHFSSPAPLPSPHSVSSSVPSAMLLIFILWSSLCYLNIFVINTLTIDQAAKMDSTNKILFLTLFYLLYIYPSHHYIFSVEPDAASNVALNVNPLKSCFGTG